MSRILLLLEHKENRRLLAQWLGMYYEVLIPDAVVGTPLTITGVRRASQQELAPDVDTMVRLLDEPFDLCILDGLALDRHWEWVQARKVVEQPVFLPVLLFTCRQEVGIVTRHLWRSVDELIISPIEKVELQARVEILLRSRQLSLQLKAANEQLQKHNQLKNRFVSILSHEFRNPLHSLLTSTQILERSDNSFPQEKKQELFQYIKKAVKKMTELIDEVLVISKGEVGKFNLNLTSVNLENFCRELIAEIQLTTGNKNSIIFTSEGKCVQGEVDEKLLRYTLNNLLLNAIKYSPTGSNVSFKLICQNGEIIFEIKDEGIGIPKEDQHRLFQAFHRGTNVSNIPGTGLGLAIVKQCVDLHRGTIELTSEVGLGSTFTVTLPSDNCESINGASL
jgi:signal transduction histidine kinase